MFNVLGVTGMVILMYTSSFYVNLIRSTSGDIMRQVANSHTLFNVINAGIFLPLIGLLSRIVSRIVPGANEVIRFEPEYLEEHLLDTPFIAIDQTRKEIVRMARVADKALTEANRSFFDGNEESFSKVALLEDGIDNLQREITHYLVELSKRSLTELESEQLPVLLHTINDIERIGDHAENIVELAERRKFERVKIPDHTLDELRLLSNEVGRMSQHVIAALENDDHEEARKALKIEDKINVLHVRLRQIYAMELGKGGASASSGLIFFDMVMNYEKIGDHFTNIAQAVLGELQWDKGVKAT